MVTLAALVVLAAPIAIAQSGSAIVIDGDTIEIARMRIRLWGVDAPESTQVCFRDGKSWECGREATRALREWLGGRTVSCTARTIDRYDRTVATCNVGNDDVSAWLVSAGWALAYRRYSSDYVANENRARNERLGIWAGEFQVPWEWRAARQKRQPVAARPQSEQ